jgi:hypothetical protein
LTRQHKRTDVFATINPTSPMVIVLSCTTIATNVCRHIRQIISPSAMAIFLRN